MVYNEKPYEKMDDLGGTPIFRNIQMEVCKDSISDRPLNNCMICRLQLRWYMAQS